MAPPDTSGDRDRAARHVSPVSTIVLTRDEIRATSAQTLDDVLRSVATVGLPAQGALLTDPANNTISMRGVSGNTVLVLVDGVPINDAYFGSVLWLQLPVEQIERIEIIHGSQASRYAMHSVSGAILVTTRRPQTDGVELQGHFGRYLSPNANPYRLDSGRNYNSGRANLLASKGLGARARVTINANFTGTKGYWLDFYGDEGYTQLSATTGSLRLDLTPSRRTAAFIHLGAAALLPHGLNKATAQFEPLVLQRSDTRTADVSAGFTQRDMSGGTLVSNVFYSDTRRYRLDNPYDANTTRVPTHDAGGSAVWTRALRGKVRPAGIAIGVDARRITSEVRSLSYPFPFFGDSTRVSTSGETRMAGGFAQLDWTASERLTVHTALRLDGFQSLNWRYTTAERLSYPVPSRASARVSPTIALGYALQPGLTVRASAYAGSNAPTHAALSPFNTFGREDQVLGAERVTGAEVGLDVRRGSFTLLMNVFQQNLRAGQTVNGSDFAFVLVNGERRRSRGVETSIEWSRSAALSVRASHTFLSSIVTANPFDGPRYDYPARVGNRDPEVPAQALSGVVRGRLPLGMQGLLRGRYITQYSRLPEIGFSQPAPVAVFDASLSVPIARDFELWVRGENVLNRRYANADYLQAHQQGAPSLVTVGLRLLGWQQ